MQFSGDISGGERFGSDASGGSADRFVGYAKIPGDVAERIALLPEANHMFPHALAISVCLV